MSPPSSLPSPSLSSPPVPVDVGAVGHLTTAGPSAQRERRVRILEAAIALGRAGDFEAVQMRLVAERADVALGTLYRYFPSKVHLLRAVLVAELEEVLLALRSTRLPAATAAGRVDQLIDQSIRAHQAEPRLHAALIRSYVFAGENSSPENSQVSLLIRAIICRAIRSDDQPGAEDLEVAGVLADVWLSATVGWVAGRISADEVRAKMERATGLLLGD